MALTHLKTQEDYQKFESDGGLSVVHFMADWAPQCEQMNSVLIELLKQEELKNVKFASLPAEDVPEVSLQCQITAVPTVLIFLNGKVVDRVDGADTAELTNKIKKQAAKYSLTSMTPVIEPQDINARLKFLINSSKCMVFMKGTPDAPKCGFCRTLMELLKKHDGEFGYFDILSDEEVRQGLKEYSNWPTYPQLYVDGELVGGLDILKEMDESNELTNLLPKKINLDKRLKDLTNRSLVMIFMKGDPSGPRCGFSKQLVLILNELGTKFDSFDILTDEDVRQGLKTYSSWPTYPQVYVKGELIGGLDIIKEMKEDGSLAEALKGE